MNYEILSIDRLEENKKLLGEVERLRNEKQELLETIDMITTDASEYVKKIDKAIDYIKTNTTYKRETPNGKILKQVEIEELWNILKGEEDETNNM